MTWIQTVQMFYVDWKSIVYVYEVKDEEGIYHELKGTLSTGEEILITYFPYARYFYEQDGEISYERYTNEELKYFIHAIIFIFSSLDLIQPILVDYYSVLAEGIMEKKIIENKIKK